MQDFQYRYLLKSSNSSFELTVAPTIFKEESILQFTGQAKTFLEAAYRSDGVMTDVKFICLERKSEDQQWEENDSYELDFTKWEMEGDLFKIKTTPTYLNS